MSRPYTDDAPGLEDASIRECERNRNISEQYLCRAKSIVGVNRDLRGRANFAPPTAPRMSIVFTDCKETRHVRN
jgi:hypothetical protein